MHKTIVWILFGLFLINCCYAECSENQININSASLEELQEITGIGPVYAQRIIDQRSFSSLDELVNVNGIAEKRLESIKSQDLACVYEEKIKENQDDEKDNEEKTETEFNEDDEKDDKEKPEIKDKESSEIEELKKEIQELKKELNEKDIENDKEEIEINEKTKTIKLSSSNPDKKSLPKNIKSSENLENSEKSDYAVYGFVAFSFFISILVFIRRKKIKEELV